MDKNGYITYILCDISSFFGGVAMPAAYATLGAYARCAYGSSETFHGTSLHGALALGPPLRLARAAIGLRPIRRTTIFARFRYSRALYYGHGRLDCGCFDMKTTV